MEQNSGGAREWHVYLYFHLQFSELCRQQDLRWLTDVSDELRRKMKLLPRLGLIPSSLGQYGAAYSPSSSPP
ncbi:hypothetical protein SBA7_580009 [Candidatus Sulfotelmatobacter sp. SbA7]|nr:hypothetical protein SBA7_580009 [Candidatus Sulfotelmatobacter sp. SbA7]